MNWLPGITTPAAAWLFALLVPLVVFYFLKLKRTRVEIPSLALWLSVIEDQRVNSPFQKFKRNLLLLLQVAVLCLLALAAMQPFVRGRSQRAEHLPILIDCSASMAATDDQGRSRLDLVKQQVREIITNLLSGQRLTLVAVSDSAQRLTEFTDNQRVLLDALNRIRVREVEGNLEEGLQLAQALARSFQIDAVRFYSDGNLPLRPDETGRQVAGVNFDLPFELQFHRIDPGGANIGITAFTARRSGPERWDVFVRVEGSDAGQTAAGVELLAGGVPVGDDTIILEAGQSQRIVFTYDSADAASLEVRLRPDGPDSLAADNVAWLDLPVSRPLSVYCPLELAAYRHSLSGLGGIELLPTGGRDPQRALYDLVIADDLAQADQEAQTFLFIGVVPADLSSLISIGTGLAQVVDWKRDDPLLQHVMFQDVEITDQPTLAEGVDEGDIESLGYEILVQGNTGPLVLRRREGRIASVYLLFHTDRSTLPYRVGFPVLVSNVVGLARDQAELSDVRGIATGVLPELQVPSKAAVDVRTPSGQSLSVLPDAEGTLKGIAAHEVGQYDIRQEGQTIRRVGAGLLSATETSLWGVEEIQFRELTVGASDQPVSTDKPLWSYLAYAAFVFLLVEWWVFLRRPGGEAA
jgi:Ca-activated chloride channel homolog